MLEYFLLLFIVLILSLFHKKPKLNIILSCLAIILFSSLRDISIGVDIPFYIDAFHIIKYTDWEDLFLTGNMFIFFEKGFIVYNKILSYITSDDQIYFLFYSSVAIIPLALLYYNESKKDASKYMFFFLCLPSFLILLSGVRQAMAVGITLLAYLYLRKNEYAKSIFLYILACSFHTTAAITIIIPFLRKIEITRKRLYGVFIFSVIIYTFRLSLMTSIFQFMSSYKEKYSLYSIEATNSYGTLVFYALIIFAAYFLCSRQLDKNPEFIINRNIMVATFVFQIFASVQSNIARVNYYFIPFIPILLVNIIDSNIIKKNLTSTFIINTLGYVFGIALFTTFLFMIANASSMRLVPYKFFF